MPAVASAPRQGDLVVLVGANYPDASRAADRLRAALARAPGSAAWLDGPGAPALLAALADAPARPGAPPPGSPVRGRVAFLVDGDPALAYRIARWASEERVPLACYEPDGRLRPRDIIHASPQPSRTR